MQLFVKRQNASWEEFARLLEQKFDIRFFYDKTVTHDIRVEVVADSILLEQLLEKVFEEKNIHVSKDSDGNYFLFPDFKLKNGISRKFFKPHESGNKTDLSDEYNINKDSSDTFLKTYNEYISENIVVGTNGIGKNEKARIKGFVYNNEDGVPVGLARVLVVELNKSLVASASGRFELELVPGNYTVTINSLGMYEKTFKLTVFSDGDVNFAMRMKSFILDETVVTAERNQNLRTTSMGFEKITAKTIKEMPVMLGEKDVVKMALLLPGVQTIGEISSGFNVRGSPSDQNMFIINDVPIYNSSHLFGLFTTFNSDAISEFKFYKNSIPEQYGGLLSSVFDIDVKTGNNQYFSMRAGIGPTSARAMAEGPIKKDGSSYLISFRSSYSDWMLRQVDNLDVRNSSATFQDALMDFNFPLNEKNKLDLFVYWSRDYADLALGIENEYFNLGAAAEWTHTFNKRLTSGANLALSQYTYKESNFEVEYLANRHSFDISHYEFKWNLMYNPGRGKNLEFGLNSKFIRIDNGDFLPLYDESRLTPLTFEAEQSISNSVFASYKWDISSRFSIDAGIRATLYSYLGPKTIYSYIENEPKDIDNIVDTTHYGKNSFINNYQNVDYNFAAKYELTDNLTIKAGFNLLHQYAFMLSNTFSVSPSSKWKLSDPNLKPMQGEQFSAGLYKNFANDKIETSIEGYSKRVKNLVEYKDGAEFVANPVRETNIIQGNLRSYGVEFMLKKKMDKLTGWVNYTWSKAEVTAFNPVTGEMNNRGYSYPANYDRPHAANMTLNYKLSKRLSFSANVVYSTGRPITFPSSVYYLNDVQITGFSKRNDYRLPDYFRTDISISLEGNLKKNKLAHGFWSLSFYNLTGRRNAYSMVFQNVDGEIKGYKISILGAMIPSLNYNLKLGNYEN
ncbi:MAG: carboxypeptidase regulatory-like domain-containing protein [Draconibacterium sp.]